MSHANRVENADPERRRELDDQELLIGPQADKQVAVEDKVNHKVVQLEDRRQRVGPDPRFYNIICDGVEDVNGADPSVDIKQPLDGSMRTVAGCLDILVCIKFSCDDGAKGDGEGYTEPEESSVRGRDARFDRRGREEGLLCDGERMSVDVPVFGSDDQKGHKERDRHRTEGQEHPCQPVDLQTREIVHQDPHQLSREPEDEVRREPAESLGPPIERVDVEDLCDEQQRDGVVEAVVEPKEPPKVDHHRRLLGCCREEVSIDPGQVQVPR